METFCNYIKVSQMSRSIAPTDVHVVLNNGSPNHRSSAKHESGSDTLDGCKVDPTLAKHRIHDEIHERYQDHDSERVQVLQDVVWHAMEHHRLGLAVKIAVDLVVCHPVQSAIDQHRYALNKVKIRSGTLTGTKGKHCKQTNHE
jgi:hypothetical protein